MAIWVLAKKEILVLWRDKRSFAILFALPVVLIAILGMTLGEGFGKKPDDRLRVSIVDLDQGFTPPDFKEIVESMPKDPKALQRFPYVRWSRVVQQDLADTAGIKVEIISTRQEAEKLVQSGKRAAVLVFGPEFSQRVYRCSFLPKGISPFYREGVNLEKIDLALLRDPTQLSAAGIIEQVAQVTVLRTVLPWMIGRGFEAMASRLGNFAQAAIKQQFPDYDFTAKNWAGLTKQQEVHIESGELTKLDSSAESSLLSRGAFRYQILVPSYTVMFAFFLSLTAGGLFASERRQGTLKRLLAAPISRGEIILGKALPCLIVSAVQGILLLAAGKFIFGMSWGTHPQWLPVIVVTTSIAATGMAILVAILARTETQVVIYGTMLVLAMSGISGCLMPRALMPEEMQRISLITPHAWSLDAYAQLLLNPTPNIGIVVTACGVLTLFGLAFLLLAALLQRLQLRFSGA